ncbi:dynein axonemal intermediate chain 4-like [Tubulanus polymorphus]|uniref:dynein axonemal intermediate chain 4-like n=1 Tax=Tubulanus polymorphus TaxID=672921 RepID=UPI003DA3870B
MKRSTMTGNSSRKTGQGASSSRNKNMSVSQSRIGGRSQMVSSRTMLSSSSKKNLPIGGAAEKPQIGRAPVQVIDDAGMDRTPQPLLHLDPGALKKGQSNILADSSGGTPTDLMSQASIYQTGTVSTYGGGPFTRSVFSTSQSEKSSESFSAEDIGEPSADIISAYAGIRHRREDTKEVLTESDLEKSVDVHLSETETIWLLDMPGTCVSLESDEATAIKTKNEQYQELIKGRVGNDLYAERGMNTFNDAEKVKGIQTTKIGLNDVGIMATTWDMYDMFEALKEKEKKEKEAEEEGENSEEKTGSRPETAKSVDEQTMSVVDVIADDTTDNRAATQASNRTNMDSRNTFSSQTDSDSVFTSKDSGLVAVPDQNVVNDRLILESENLKKDLFVMERVVNMNTYQPKQASYRMFEIIPDIDNKKELEAAQASQQLAVANVGPNLDRLWAYGCPLTKGRNVSCIAWNRINPDLLAVGYGQFEFTGQKTGLVCCWSLKNPEFPERIYTCSAGVTAMDFSATNPNLLAVGLYDGRLEIFNVRSTKDEPILDSFESEGKHINPVWQLKWIEKERGSGEERAEVLVSVSTDGRVTQWSIRKGFECYDLMKLKRVTPKEGQGSQKKDRKGDSLISRYSGGYCFDFSKRDPNIYLTGTEEGQIHRCSCSYNEQYLESYFGHTGPVYAIQWSPLVNDAFLSCSADWSIRLWKQDRTKPILSFHSSTKSTNSVCWSPNISTVFSCVNEKSVEIWDLNQNTLDPIIQTQPVSGAKLSCVTFARNTDCVLVGDSEGQVTVYQLKCMPDPPVAGGDALEKVIQSSLASQLQSSEREDTQG